MHKAFFRDIVKSTKQLARNKTYTHGIEQLSRKRIIVNIYSIALLPDIFPTQMCNYVCMYEIHTSECNRYLSVLYTYI